LIAFFSLFFGLNSLVEKWKFAVTSTEQAVNFLLQLNCAGSTHFENLNLQSVRPSKHSFSFYLQSNYFLPSSTKVYGILIMNATNFLLIDFYPDGKRSGTSYQDFGKFELQLLLIRVVSLSRKRIARAYSSNFAKLEGISGIRYNQEI
jgi:hypothetical protein